MKQAVGSLVVALVTTLLFVVLPPTTAANPMRITNRRVNRDTDIDGRCTVVGRPNSHVNDVMVRDRRGRMRPAREGVTGQEIRCVMNERFPGFPQARSITSAAVVYKRINNGSWHFDHVEQGTFFLENMPPPDFAALVGLVEADTESAFRSFYRGQITAIRGYTPQPDTLVWADFTNITLGVVADLDWVAQDDIQTMDVNIACRYRRADGNSPWSLGNCVHSASDRTIRSTRRRRSGEEVHSLTAQAYLRTARARRDALPAVEIPRFATELELVDFVYGIFFESDRAHAEAYLYPLFMPQNYPDGVLNDAGEEVLRAALDAAYGDDGNFRSQYCRRPLPRDNVSWNNKDGRRVSRISGRSTDQGFRLTNLSLFILHGPSGAALSSLSPDPCTEELNGGFHLGDRVRVDYWGTEKEGFVIGESGDRVTIMFGRSPNDTEAMDVQRVSLRQ